MERSSLSLSLRTFDFLMTFELQAPDDFLSMMYCNLECKLKANPFSLKILLSIRVTTTRKEPQTALQPPHRLWVLNHDLWGNGGHIHYVLAFRAPSLTP